MRDIKVAAISPELKVADIEFNVSVINKSLEIMATKDVDIVAFPELCVTGSTCKDLFLQRTLIKKAWEGVLDICKNMPETLVAVVGCPVCSGRNTYNASLVLYRGEVIAVYTKQYLSYFEKKWFESAKHYEDTINIEGNDYPLNRIISSDDYSFAVEIGADMNTIISPALSYASKGIDFIVNTAAMPATKNFDEVSNIIRDTSRRIRGGYIYAGAGIGESSEAYAYQGEVIIANNGEILKEKNNFSFDTKGVIDYISISESPALDEDAIYEPNLPYNDSDISAKIAKKSPYENPNLAEQCKQVLNIQAYALARRMKQINCNKLVIGVSGGLDSTLALFVCCKAMDALNLPHEDIQGITMPGMGTTETTKNIADELMDYLKITPITISIKEAAENHLKDIQHEGIFDVTFENAQARERTQVLMDYANKVGGLVIGTGDLSEAALGWCTYGGDHLSMYAVNEDIPKTLIKDMLNAYIGDNEELRVIADQLFTIPISPELLPPSETGEIAQKTEETVGPYELHDYFLYHMVVLDEAPVEILREAKKSFKGKYDADEIKKWLNIFYRRFFNNQFKRDCAANGPSVGFINLSPSGYKIPSDASSSLWRV